MGGKNPLVIAADADLDVAVDVAISGSFYATGQRCTASSRLIVVDAIHDAFVDRMLARIKPLVVGDAFGEGTQTGPVVDQSQLDTTCQIWPSDVSFRTPPSMGESCSSSTDPAFICRPRSSRERRTMIG